MSEAITRLRRTHRLVHLVLVLSMVLNPGWIAGIQAQERCETALAEARKSYGMARFSEAIQRLQPCLEENHLEKGQLAEGYELMALSHLALFEDRKAGPFIQKLLEVRPDYRPDPSIYPGSFIRLFEEAQEQQQRLKKQRLRRKRLWIGSAVAVIGATVAYFLLRSDPPLPGPPSFPN